MAKDSGLFLLACLIASLLAAAIAVGSGILWWGVCLLHAEGGSPRWCDYLTLYLYLLWLSVFGLCYWAILRVGKSLDVH